MNRRGSVEIIVVLGLVALLGASALVIDYGVSTAEKIKLDNALENAAIAGAHSLIESDAAATAKALEYLTLNGQDPALATVTITNNHRQIRVDSTKQVTYSVAKVFGRNNGIVGGHATAIIGPVSSVASGVRPLGVEFLTYTYGDQITLKEDAGDGVYGNYGSVALGGTGNAVYVDNLLNGYNGVLKVGDVIETEPGNKAGAINQLRNYLDTEPSSYPDIPDESIRLWTLPLVDNYDPQGRDDMTIVAFAKFYIETIRNQGGQAEVVGRFIEYVDLGTVDPTEEITGLYGTQLIR